MCSVLYPPHGLRRVGAGLARAWDYNGVTDYLQTANDQVCLLLQVEIVAVLKALDEILAVDGVDGVFIGPADLAADMGKIVNPGAPAVQAAAKDALIRKSLTGKAGGILTSDRTLAKGYAEIGAKFLAGGV